MKPLLSIIIPTLNEQAVLAHTLDLLEQEGIAACSELIVVDGSQDDTSLIAAERSCRLITTDRPQRARQMNLGAASASGKFLLFLHADTQLTLANIENLFAAMEAQPSLLGGGFFRRFDLQHWFLALIAPMADRRSRKDHIFLGDQAIFCRRTAFDELGGYDENLNMGEDLDFSLRMRDAGLVVALGPVISSSGRRYERLGPVRQVFEDWQWSLKFVKERAQIGRHH